MKLVLDAKNRDVVYVDLREHEQLDQPAVLAEARAKGALYAEVYRLPGRGHGKTIPPRWVLTLRVSDGHVVKAGRDAA